ncbi:aminotransferase A [Bacillus aerolatus]|uniref:Aminotransferase n=1 Tax=Bacillus aerolatus TaxID=2653354 RepID=A0A6I1FJM9_9BACI|nr:aminotransferase A [Bacillus aerolatus]KAB7706209.1 aminotransferase A [Bacillus aerolatus]
MINLVNKQLKSIEVSGIRAIANKAATDPTIINMTLGQPDFPTPEKIKLAGKKAIDDNQTAYTHNAGLLELRQAVSDYMNRLYGLSYRPEDEIIVTIGASEAIDMTFRAILEEGSEVIIPGPVYPGYEPTIKLCGAVPVYIDTRETGFKVTAAMIEEKITENTRCIVLSYPSNPTGCTLDQEEIVKIADLLKGKNIFILSDEIYSGLVYDKQHHSIASVSELKEKTILINGLSKSHAMTGWRIGFVLAPSEITAELLKVHLFNTVCASTISQYAAIEALTQEMDEVAQMKAEYKRRRDYVYERAVSMGLDVVKPESAFYLFPSIKYTNMTSLDFALKLLEEGVAVVPGSAFSELGEGYIRISFACSMEKLEEGCNRIERFLKKTALSAAAN